MLTHCDPSNYESEGQEEFDHLWFKLFVVVVGLAIGFFMALRHYPGGL